MNKEKSRHKIAQMFDQIASKYDAMNQILSLGQHQRWRRSLRRHLPNLDHLKIVDFATGTGDQILALKDVKASFTGIDISIEMLKKAKEKCEKFNHVNFQLGSALSTPFEDDSIDVITMSFGIRNVSDSQACMKEMLRILKPGGRALILEFSKAENWALKHLSGIYLHHFVPWIGNKITKNHDAYTYLPKTIEDFPSGKDFLSMMHQSGFINGRQIQMNLGTVSLYIGEKKHN